MVVYSFSYIDDIIDLDYNPVTRRITARSRFGYPIPRAVTEDEMGVLHGTVLDSFCQGPDFIIIRANTFHPFALVDVVENSAECPVITPDPEPEPDEPDEPQPERLIYRLHWQDFEEQNITVDIIDRQNLAPTATEKIVPLEGTGNPFEVSIIDNDETPLSPIRAKEAVIRFNSTDDIGLSNFIEGEDNRWYVIAYHGEALPSQTIFQGFLTFSDSSEPYLPAPNEVTLVATDNIGLLKDQPLTRPDGLNPKGKFKIIEYLAWALQKTNLHLSLRVVHNLREEHNPEVCMYESCYLDAKTFEDEIGTSVSCYEVIERILGEDAFLVQMGGEWWIIRPDEMQSGTYTTWRFDSGGIIVPDDLIDNPDTFDARRYIGENEVRYWSNEATNVLINRPHREVKEVYRYEYPKELLDNVDFSQGARLFPLTGTFTRDGNPWVWEGYELQDWTILQGTFTNPSPAPMATAYIRREFDFGVEKNRFAYLQSFAGFDQWIQSNPVPVGKDDRINLSFFFNMPTAIGIIRNFFLNMHLIHVADNGQVSTLIYKARNLLRGENPIVWETYNGWSQRVAFEWDSIKGDGWTKVHLGEDDIIVPDDGEIYLVLPFLFETIIYYKDIKFTYQPFINSSLMEFEGQENKVIQPGKFQSKYEGQAYMGDSPRQLFKGALLRKVGDKYLLAGNFTHAAYPGFVKPFGWWQAFAAWYLKKRTMRLFEGEIRGLDVAGGLTDCVHQWVLTDTTEHTEGKTFMALHYTMDYNDCGGPIVLHEIVDEDHEKTFEDTHEFRYLEKR